MVFGIRKKKPVEVNERPAMGYIEIEGIGRVEVESTPDNIPSRIWVGNCQVKIDKRLYKYLWAWVHATPEGRKKLGSII